MKSEKSLLAGGIAGMVSQTLTWPLEYIKTTKQLPKYYNEKSIMRIISNEIKTKGPLTTFTGLSPQLIGSIPRASVRFYSYNYFNNYFNNSDKKNNLITLGAGLFGGAIEAITVMTPAEVIKVKSIKNPDIKSSYIIGDILKKQGFHGLYQGIVPTTLRQSTTQGFSFFAFNYSKPYYSNMCNNYNVNNSIASLLAGITGGVFAVALNNPIDSIKTSIQSSNKKESFIRNILNVYNKYGITGFYRGGLLRMTRVGPLHGITFLTYDIVSKFL